jgi:glucose-1-phosphate thymidylyltransferase
MKYNKAILLSGGQGTRLRPITNLINKHLLPVHDKPMIFYSLSIIMLSKIRDICIVSDLDTTNILKKFFGNGEWLGIKLEYIEQKKSLGIANGISISRNFIKNSNFLLMLGDGLFFGSDLTTYLKKAQTEKSDAKIFSYEVKNPSFFGVLSSNKKNYKIIEKPKKFIGNKIITGMYFLPNYSMEIAKKTKISKRGEMEITDLLNEILKKRNCKIYDFKRGIKWLDMGTLENLTIASNLIKNIEHNNAQKIACLEEIALNNGWIKNIDYKFFKNKYGNTDYFQYLKKL